MLHTNRRKKAATASAQSSTSAPTPGKPCYAKSTKRTLSTDSEGWTWVIDRPRHGGRGDAIARNGGSVQVGDWERNGVWYLDMDIGEMEREYAAREGEWMDAGGLEGVRGLLMGEGRKRARVERVVCLGLGSLQNARAEGRRTSCVQLAALRAVVGVVASGKPLCVLFQDPQFTALDVRFLTSLGYTVVNHPEAFEYIDRQTLVYAIHCYGDVYKAVCSSGGGREPAVVVGTDVDVLGRGILSRDMEDTVGRLREMVDGYEVREFPQWRWDFSDTRIYWRVEGEKEAILKEKDLLMGDPMLTSRSVTNPKSMPKSVAHPKSETESNGFVKLDSKAGVHVDPRKV